MKKEKTECREVVIALLSQKYSDNRAVGDFVVNPKYAIKNSDGKCIGYAKCTLNDLCEKYPADEWMELVVRAVENELLDGIGIERMLCRCFENMNNIESNYEYYKNAIIRNFLVHYNNLVEVKKYDFSDSYSLHRMSEGEFIIMKYLNNIGSISFTKEVYKIMNLVRNEYEQILNGTMDYFLGFSMNENEFIKFTNSRFVLNRTIREV